MMAVGGVTLTIRSRGLEKQRMDTEQLSVGPLKTLGDLVRTLDEGDPFHSRDGQSCLRCRTLVQPREREP